MLWFFNLIGISMTIISNIDDYGEFSLSNWMLELMTYEFHD